MSGRRHWSRRTALLRVVAGKGFSPSNPWDIPAVIESAEIVLRELYLYDCRPTVRLWNQRAIRDFRQQGDNWNREWYLVVASAHQRPNHIERRVKPLEGHQPTIVAGVPHE